MQDLTDRQQEVLEAIKELIAEMGQSPSLREIAEYFDQPRASSVRYTVEALHKKGYIRRRRDPIRGRYAARGISIVEDGSDRNPEGEQHD